VSPRLTGAAALAVGCFVGSSLHFARWKVGVGHLQRERWRVLVIDAPRRAMIRRRGKRGRIRRAEAAEAYENRNLLTSDARDLQKTEVHTSATPCRIASPRSTSGNSDHILDLIFSEVLGAGALLRNRFGRTARNFVRLSE
jgi:hypothetical protein